MNIKNKEIHIRLSHDDHLTLSTKANIYGYSKAEFCRRIIHEYLSTDSAKESLEIISSTFKDSLKLLDNKFFELKELEYKILNESTLNRFLTLSLLENSTDLTDSEIKQLYELARKKAYYFLNAKTSLDHDIEENDIILEDYLKNLI